MFILHDYESIQENVIQFKTFYYVSILVLPKNLNPSVKVMNCTFFEEGFMEIITTHLFIFFWNIDWRKVFFKGINKFSIYGHISTFLGSDLLTQNLFPLFKISNIHNQRRTTHNDIELPFSFLRFLLKMKRVNPNSISITSRSMKKIKELQFASVVAECLQETNR